MDSATSVSALSLAPVSGLLGRRNRKLLGSKETVSSKKSF